MGAKLEYKGLQNERGALKHNAAKIDKLTTESHSIKNVLNGQNSVKLGAEGVDSLKSLNMKKTGTDATKNLNDATLKSNAGTSATESLGIKDSNKQISLNIRLFCRNVLSLSNPIFVLSRIPWI